MRATATLVSVLLSASLSAAAATYSMSGGYQYISGSGAYWGHEAWGYGIVRLAGGWYPSAGLTLSSDSNYSRVIGPGLGLEKGFAGLGRARATYTYYGGTQRQTGLSGASHAGELGFFRLWTPRFSTDFLYRRVSGDLFAGSDAVLTPEEVFAYAPRHATVHQAEASGALDLRRGPRLSVSLAGSFSRGERRTLTQAFGLALPLVGGFWAQANFTLAQGAGRDRRYVSTGIFRAFSGRTRRGR